MKYHKTCPCCWSVVTAYTINLSNVMLDAFIKFAKKYTELNVWLRKWEIWLTNSQYSNFQNLRYFWLILMMWWKRYLSSTWKKWYMWEISIRDVAWFMWWEVLPIDHEAWITHDKEIKDVYIGSLLQQYQDHREKYIDEKTKAITIY